MSWQALILMKKARKKGKKKSKFDSYEEAAKNCEATSELE